MKYLLVRISKHSVNNIYECVVIAHSFNANISYVNANPVIVTFLNNHIYNLKLNAVYKCEILNESPISVNILVETTEEASDIFIVRQTIQTQKL